jgi:IrrE N-terminal-like domain
MAEVAATYRHAPFSAEPEQLTPEEIWAVARHVRGQLEPDSLTRALDLTGVEERIGRAQINGVEFEVSWDLENEVRNAAGKPVMGVTEYDKSVPDCVMVAINGPKLSGLSYLMRSTIAHELGHVIFDAPRWITLGPAPSPAFLMGESAAAGKYDRREIRANEFMGALLAPPALLRVDLQRCAKRSRLQPSDRASGVIRGAAAYDSYAQEADAVQDIVFGLAELYGVSESFMRVRLDRYELLRLPRGTARR